MDDHRPWTCVLMAGLLWLVLAVSLMNCGGTGSKDAGGPTAGDSNPGPQVPATDYSDYAFEEPIVTGRTFYIDPVNGSEGGDGSADHPWLTLQQVVEDGLIQYYRHTEANNPDSALEIVNAGAPVQGGDRLLLRSGYHGHIALNTFIFAQWLTIAAQDGQAPVLSQIRLNGAFEKLYFKNLTILKDSYEGPGNYWEADAVNHNSDACLYLASNSFWGRGRLVKAYGLKVGTTTDASAWAAADWVQKSAAGISLRSATECEIVNCTIENVSFGLNIEYASDHSAVVGNSVKYFSGDGCRLISNDVYLAYNTITDCLKVDDNHDDAIQSYSRGSGGSAGTGVLYNNVVRGNLIIGTTDVSHPLAGSPQGIGCFDGLYDGWVVENNVVIVDHYHGISFYGLRNSAIVHNTVIDQNPGNATTPWIMVTDHKNGTPSDNVTVANNIAYRSIITSGTQVTAGHNLVIEQQDGPPLALDELFEGPDEFNLHLLVNATTQSVIIDQGVAVAGMMSSLSDRDGAARDAAPDLGAYEAD